MLFSKGHIDAMNNVCTPMILRLNLQVSQKDICRDMDALIETRLKSAYEGVKRAVGLIIPGTLKLRSRTLGYNLKQNLNCDMAFTCECEATVCSPKRGHAIMATVSRKLPIGAVMHVHYDGHKCIEVIVPNDTNLKMEISPDEVVIGEQYMVEVLGVKTEISQPRTEADKKNTYITVIGRIITDEGNSLAGQLGLDDPDKDPGVDDTPEDDLDTSGAEYPGPQRADDDMDDDPEDDDPEDDDDDLDDPTDADNYDDEDYS